MLEFHRKHKCRAAWSQVKSSSHLFHCPFNLQSLFIFMCISKPFCGLQYLQKIWFLFSLEWTGKSCYYFCLLDENHYLHGLKCFKHSEKLNYWYWPVVPGNIFHPSVWWLEPGPQKKQHSDWVALEVWVWTDGPRWEGGVQYTYSCCGVVLTTEVMFSVREWTKD